MDTDDQPAGFDEERREDTSDILAGHLGRGKAKESLSRLAVGNDCTVLVADDEGVWNSIDNDAQMRFASGESRRLALQLDKGRFRAIACRLEYSA